MRKHILFAILFLVFQNAGAQAIQGTIRHGSHSKEVYLTVRNNSAAKISGNITRLDFTLSMFLQSYYATNAWGFMELSMLPKPGTGTFTSYDFLSFLNNFLTTSWTGSLAINLDPGQEMDVAAFVLWGNVGDAPDVTHPPLRLTYADPMNAEGRLWRVDVDGVNLTEGDNKFYTQGPPTTAYNEVGSGGVSLITFSFQNLPVTLKNFDADPEGSIVNLNWTTTEETNSDYFDIEHSVNAKKWRSIGKISALGESKSRKDYQFKHNRAVSGVNYYRLKMVDKDKTFAYSKINSVHVQHGDDNGAYPNPAADVVFFKAADLQNLSQVQILNTLGRVVYESQEIGESGIDIGHLPAGSFIIKFLKSNGEAYSRKLVKK
jgi:hypothetical protein